MFSLCVFSLCFLSVFSVCAFCLCFLSVFSLCVFSLCFLSVFSLYFFSLRLSLSLSLCFLFVFLIRLRLLPRYQKRYISKYKRMSFCCGQGLLVSYYLLRVAVNSLLIWWSADSLSFKSLTRYFGFSGYPAFSFSLTCWDFLVHLQRISWHWHEHESLLYISFEFSA